MEPPPNRSVALGGSVAWVFWGKPVFQITASSQWVESLARGRVVLVSDGARPQAERRPGGGMEAEKADSHFEQNFPCVILTYMFCYVHG
jgi:hypothetical protein